MKVIKQSRKNYVTTNWSGGSTSQVLIYPETASVTAHDFDYRISSAVVSIDSDFTKYSGYTRYITTLDNSIVLNDEIVLQPLKVHKFSGDDNTYSKGSCTDFNLICKNHLDCNMIVDKVSYNKRYYGYTHYIFYSSNSCSIKINDCEHFLEANDSLIIYEKEFKVSVDIKDGYVISLMIKV